MEDTIDFVLKAEKAGATLVEIGVPFSDPVADGPVIMEADVKALQNHIHLPEVMGMVKTLRTKTAIPIVLFTYFNPVFKYPAETFFKEAKEIGIDGVIIPDLPCEEQEEIRPLADENGVDIIQIIAPATEERICAIAKKATGFIYVMSPAGAPYKRSSVLTNPKDIIRVIKETTDTPVVIDFDSQPPTQENETAGITDGLILGSRLVDLINKNGKEADPMIAKSIAELKAKIGD